VEGVVREALGDCVVPGTESGDRRPDADESLPAMVSRMLSVNMRGVF